MDYQFENIGEDLIEGDDWLRFFALLLPITGILISTGSIECYGCIDEEYELIIFEFVKDCRIFYCSFDHIEVIVELDVLLVLLELWFGQDFEDSGACGLEMWVIVDHFLLCFFRVVGFQEFLIRNFEDCLEITFLKFRFWDIHFFLTFLMLLFKFIHMLFLL